jgi:OOP family OmpA-OmpF porin
MRESRAAAVVMAVALAMTTGCAIHDREWGMCAVAGGVIGGAVGGLVGGIAENNVDDSPTNGERGAAIGGGLIAGGAIGALLGHSLCDPEKKPPTPPPVAAPPPPPPPKGTKLATLGSANFDFNKATVKPEGRKILEDAVKTLKDNPDVKVVVEGHTDSVGSDAYNLKLSQRRAKAVADYLVSEGVASSRVRVEGFGKSKPIADNKTAEGRAKNRRAEVVVD